MKNIFLLLLLMFSFNIAFSQHKQKPTIEIYSSTIGITNPRQWSYSNLMGGSVTPHGNGYYNIGANFIQPLNKWVSIFGGIEFSNHKIKTTYYTDMPPLFYLTPTYENIQLLSFPINVQLNFFKYFFARSGFMIDVQTKNNASYLNNQSGIGLNFEVGAKYEFKNHITIFLSPFLQIHSAILFHSEEYTYRMIDDGINVGIGYRF